MVEGLAGGRVVDCAEVVGDEDAVVRGLVLSGTKDGAVFDVCSDWTLDLVVLRLG
jgi:hypothetical protein